MKAGRNDPCPCGSGKKYKKCCLGTDRVASAAQAIAISSPRSVTGSAGSDSFSAKTSERIGSSESAHATRASKPPSPPDPVVERAERLWEEFESQSAEGRIAVFLEALEDAEAMDDSLAFEMLSRLHSDAMMCGGRRRYCEFVDALRERRPEAYEQSASYYLSWCVRDALAESRQEAVASLSGELAARAGRDIDLFNRAVEALEYHGQLSVLVAALRIAWPGVKSSEKIVPWGVSEFMNKGADYEIFDYLEHATSPDPTDPVLLERVKFYVEDPREEYLREFISDLTGKAGRQWRKEDFALRRPKKARDEWDDDGEGGAAMDPAAINLSRLISEFVGYLRRKEGVPYPRAQLVRHEIYRYFIRRHGGQLDPQPSMLDQTLRPNQKLPTPPPPAHPLCPEAVTLEVFLVELLGIFNELVHRSSAVFQAMPAWLRFLESRGLIDADMRQKVAKELLPLHGAMSKMLQTYTEDPTLYDQVQVWPADAARGPSELLG